MDLDKPPPFAVTRNSCRSSVEGHACAMSMTFSVRLVMRAPALAHYIDNYLLDGGGYPSKMPPVFVQKNSPCAFNVLGNVEGCD